jgi:hypothetical protein
MPCLLTNSVETKKYSTPRLTIYGEAKKLTASGTGGTTETGSQPSCQNNINRRACP